MQSAYEQRMAELRTRFAVRAGEDRRKISEALAAGDRPGARRLAHGLAGIAGTFGHGELGERAYELERALDDPRDDEGAARCWRELDRLLGDAAAAASLLPRPPSDA